MGEKRDLKKNHKNPRSDHYLGSEQLDCFDCFCTFCKQKQMDPFVKELKKD